MIQVGGDFNDELRATERRRGVCLLDGRVALVTGAAGGLGAVVCDTLRREGAEVVPVDLHGGGLIHEDVGTDEGNRRMIDTAVDLHGRLDILVLNAGVQFMASIAEYPESEWERLLDVMAKGPFLAMKHAWHHLTERHGGRIIVTASGLSVTAESFKCAYVAAKHAVLGLVRVAALEGAAVGLTANAVAPGWMQTQLFNDQLNHQMRLRGLTRAEVRDAAIAAQPPKRFVEPSEVANLIAFLASDLGSGISGACIPVDLGGLASAQ